MHKIQLITIGIIIITEKSLQKGKNYIQKKNYLKLTTFSRAFKNIFISID